MIQKSYEKSNVLYLVPTPIGNLEDITFRALNILKTSDIIYCEDTRTSLPLLRHFEIDKKLVSLHEHNEESRINEIKKNLDEGMQLSIISDAGMPNICDPGFKVIRELTLQGYHVISLPGANAFITALASSGLNTSHFAFFGFFERKETKAVEVLNSLSNTNVTAGFYESPHRINKTLKLIYDTLGDVNTVISREISKKFETIYRGRVSEFIDLQYKGEIVLLIECEKSNNSISLDELINDEINKGNSGKRLVKAISAKSDYNKNEIYDRYLEIIKD